MFCPKCGSANEDNAFKCLNCGTIIQAGPPPVITVKQSNTPVVILIVIIGFFVAIAIIGILAAIAIPQFMSFRMRSYDALAQSSLTQACAAANVFFMQHPDKDLSIEALAENGLIIPAAVDITIKDGSAENLMITSKHQKGRKTFAANRECHVEPIEPPTP